MFLLLKIVIGPSKKWTPKAPLNKKMSARKDGIDALYRHSYKRWSGRVYKGKHPSHIIQGSKHIFPGKQEVPGYCLLCLMMTIHRTNYRFRRHFCLCHVKHAVVIGCITLLACKCSQIKCQGTDRSVWNQHFHCHLYHWPCTSKVALFIHYNTQHNMTVGVIGHLVA